MLKMALSNLLPPEEPEMYKYHILLDHLHLNSARHIALSYAHDPRPYTMALAALEQQYGQPHHLALGEIQTILNLPKIPSGNAYSFHKFAVRVRSMVGMLQSLGQEGAAELSCASHVHRLLSKLPAECVANYARHARRMNPDAHFNLIDFSQWLQGEAECQAVAAQVANFQMGPPQNPRREYNNRAKFSSSATILHGANPKLARGTITRGKARPATKFLCSYCQCPDHSIVNCEKLKELSVDQVAKWIKEQKRCWRCGRSHMAANCGLKKPCPKCNGKHLGILHDVNKQAAASKVLYMNPQNASPKVLLKVVKVKLSNKNHTLETYAILDDGSERTILLPSAAKSLGLDGAAEILDLRTIRQETETIQGKSVTLRIAPASNPKTVYTLEGAFTADRLSLVEQSYPINRLRERYRHLHDVPLETFSNVQPEILIGTDNPHLITPIEPVRLGPRKAPAAVNTRLGWALQGPTSLPGSQDTTQCLFTSTTNSYTELKRNVEKLWQVDTLPYRNEKLITRSKQDKEAMELLEKKTIRVKVDGIERYATPLLRMENAPKLNAPKESVMPLLRRAERQLVKRPQLAVIYNKEIDKLVQAGYIAKLSNDEVSQSPESWYIPHHIVEHNAKHRIVFNCSFPYEGQVLNNQLLPGPTLGPSLIGVLLRFRQHEVAISGDIKSMFHQVRLLPEDRPLLRFLWRSMERQEQPDVYEWQVLPFGTTSSPCCAIYAVQRHVQAQKEQNEDVVEAVLQSFYVDNCLRSFSCPDKAKQLLLKLRAILKTGGFEIRQWASNFQSVVEDLPSEARSDSAELWLNQDQADPREGALGLTWHCSSDSLGFRYRPILYSTLTLRNIYKVLASQYDPLGYITPFTTRAKVLLQQVWVNNKEWDTPIKTRELNQAWVQWESELPELIHIKFPRWYGSNHSGATFKVKRRELHIFCDASERAYGSVAYFKVEGNDGQTHVSFVMARSRVAPLKPLTIPRLELSAALSGAQLAHLVQTELTLPLHQTILWTDSTIVLNWLQSESCRYKVFVANRIVEILELTSASQWRYVNSNQNPADDITRGKSIQELITQDRWHRGPAFLYLPVTQWPAMPIPPMEISCELRKPLFCGLTQSDQLPVLSDPCHYNTWNDAVESTYKKLKESSELTGSDPSNLTRARAETFLLAQAQRESFPDEFKALKAGKELSPQSCLLSLSPQFDDVLELIRVGGRLRQIETLDPDVIHPIVLDPGHPITRLLIKHYDEQLLHPGPEKVFATIRRTYWILRGRQAVKKHQWACSECRKWRGKPTYPKMADLPPCRLRLWKPPFWSTGVDCFGPFNIKIGRRQEKRWGILFKCLTTHCTHIELLTSLDTDSFLMSLRRFIARRGRPFELLSDCGTNFKGGERELKEAFSTITPHLKEHLENQQIKFHFNPPNAPHFGGMWEREVRSIKSALKVVLGAQTVTEEVLVTVLTEIEGILNSKPIGYVSADISDPDPITPNLLLMGRRDASLPQAVYAGTELLSRRRWRHSQVLIDLFWTRFIRDYLPSLQTRHKWKEDTPKLEEGTVVMCMDPQMPRGLWPVGKVTRVMASKDGRVRTVEVTINGKQYVRPVARLVTLKPVTDPSITNP